MSWSAPPARGGTEPVNVFISHASEDSRVAEILEEHGYSAWYYETGSAEGRRMAYFRDVMDIIGTVVDAAGVLIIVIGALYATGRFLLLQRGGPGGTYRLYRQDIGRAILLGLEFLVAGDIIRTVVVDPTLERVVVLGLIVLIRTFLSMSLQLELDGRWPWQRGEPGGSPPSPPR